MEAHTRETNRKIFEFLTHLDVPQDVSLRFLITYRFVSIRKFSKHIKVSHTSVLKALKHGHKNVREIIEHNLF